MEKREINSKYTDIGEGLIASEPELEYIRNSDCQIKFLCSDYERTKGDKIVHAVCEKVQSKNQWAIDADFTITVYEPNVASFSDDQLRILLFHELLHVGIGFNKDGEVKYSINPHDLEDFKLIIDRYGIDWDL